MPLDGIVISCIAHELTEQLVHGKIEKIYQPEADEIHLSVRCFGKNHKLLISASSNHPRIHLTTIAKQNPETPPMFCMLLRKHLSGGKILSIRQEEFERILYIDIENYDELGSLSVKRLIVEIMGKHSNIVLLDLSSNKIIDSVKRVSGDVNRYREILPGKYYVSPPTQNKLNPLILTKEDFIRQIKQSTSGTPIYKAIYTSLQGLSPTAGRELCFRTKIEDETPISIITEDQLHTLWLTITNFIQQLSSHHFEPNIICSKQEGLIIDFYGVHLEQYSIHHDILSYDTMSEALDQFYIHRDLSDRINQKSIDFRKFVHQTLDKYYKKTQILQQELLEAQHADDYRILGELLTANLYLIQKGDSEIEVINFYDEESKLIKINLDVRLSPAQNAQKHFKKYGKLKTALKEIDMQLQETQNEIQYFENLVVYIENAVDIHDLEELRNELVEGGYLKKRKTKGSKNKKNSNKPLTFISSDGFEIFVGKNNKQNDELTLKLADKKDLWFHTKDIPGSHVILRGKTEDIPETTVFEAAELAAFHSKARQSSNVPVDYTEIRNVKKPSGSKPGMVIYDNQKTIYITPRPNIVDILKNK